MKIGKIEGSPEEINNFFQNEDLNIQDFLEIPKPPLKQTWVMIPGLFSTVFLVGLALCPADNILARNLLYYFACAMSIWMAAAIHIKFPNNIGLTVLIATGMIALFSLVQGSITPVELIQCIKDFKK